MQLFSIGLFQLNIDGSLALDSDGSPIPTYDQSAVSGLAAVLTGWTFAGSIDFWNGDPNYRQPMIWKRWSALVITIPSACSGCMPTASSGSS